MAAGTGLSYLVFPPMQFRRVEHSELPGQLCPKPEPEAQNWNWTWGYRVTRLSLIPESLGSREMSPLHNSM